MKVHCIFETNNCQNCVNIVNNLNVFFLGLLLKKLPLDSFTLSEIVRLHLLSSGAKVSDKNVKYRFQERGGYTSLDDPGLEFRRRETALLKNLSSQAIFDLPPG